MRHSRIDLTMNISTDPKMFEVARAVESQSPLPLGRPFAPAAGNVGGLGTRSVNDVLAA
jgi:hypothetical protein